MKQELKGVPETMLIPLWARAAESKQINPIIKDDKAVEIISGIDYDFSKFKKCWLSQVGVSIRTMLLDNATREFLQRKPNAVVVNLGAGLDTRAERFNHNNVHCWYDIDVPEGIELRKQFFAENDQNHFIAKSIFDYSWIEEINITEKPILIIAEGLLMYFTEDELKPLFNQLATRLPGSEMLFEMLAPFLVGKGKHHESLSKIDSRAEFKWGLKDSKAMETWHKGIEVVEEWNYYDYHKDRWKWFGLIGQIPLVKPRLSNRIVHLKFE